MWIMTSQEFIDHAVQNMSGKNVGLRSIWLNGRRNGNEYAKPRYERFVANDSRRISAGA